MKIDYPTPELIPQLRALWKEAFGDDDEFLDSFFAAAYSPARCRCVLVDGTVAAALYWFDVTCGEQEMAYIYAVATAAAYREQGFCRALMEDTHLRLSLRGYDGAVLVPDGEALSHMYKQLGYTYCSAVTEFICSAGTDPVPMHRIDRGEYARQRRLLLPEGGIIQEDENLDFLETQASFYSGLSFLLAARQEGDNLVGLELLGNPSVGPGILLSLGLSYGRFRSPGDGKPFAMFHPLKENAQVPTYFGLAFD